MYCTNISAQQSINAHSEFWFLKLRQSMLKTLTGFYNLRAIQVFVPIMQASFVKVCCIL